MASIKGKPLSCGHAEAHVRTRGHTNSFVGCIVPMKDAAAQVCSAALLEEDAQSESILKHVMLLVDCPDTIQELWSTTLLKSCSFLGSRSRCLIVYQSAGCCG